MWKDCDISISSLSRSWSRNLTTTWILEPWIKYSLLLLLLCCHGVFFQVFLPELKVGKFYSLWNTLCETIVTFRPLPWADFDHASTFCMKLETMNNIFSTKLVCYHSFFPFVTRAAPRCHAVLGCAALRLKHTLPDLPYDFGALEPTISADIMKLHHQKHHNTYVTNLNAAEEKLAEAKEKGITPPPPPLLNLVLLNCFFSIFH